MVKLVLKQVFAVVQSKGTELQVKFVHNFTNTKRTLNAFSNSIQRMNSTRASGRLGTNRSSFTVRALGIMRPGSLRKLTGMQGLVN
jgi:hypothetical protein